MGNRKSQHKPKLTQDEITEFEQNTFFTSHEIIMLHQAYRKHCGMDGGVDKEKFTDMFSTFNKSAKALLFLDHIFRTWDTNRDGNLTFTEFLHAMSVTSRGTIKQRAEWLFHLYDLNNDGEITITEFREVLKRRLKKTQLGELEDIFHKIDKNSDGCLSMEEFVGECCTNDTLMNYLDIY